MCHYDKNILSSLHQNILSFNLLMSVLLRKWLNLLCILLSSCPSACEQNKNCFKEKKPYILLAKYTGFQGKRFVPFKFSFLSISFRLRHIFLNSLIFYRICLINSVMFVYLSKMSINGNFMHTIRFRMSLYLQFYNKRST